ncbi:MAG TPA: TCP-1/cpn60 chaperonin family protein [Candidatus Thermoplasmatota archaeon]|nr:TCP-1/cpn60 chaperonin family protein [Candidatus Thermoplasmatota archaeon]
MDGLLREGASSDDAHGLREQQREAASWLDGFLAPGYGPHGAAKLVVAGPAGDGTWVRSPALALREAAPGPLVAPYVDLATRIHQAVGDGATMGTLLAARLVARALREHSPPPAAWLDGYRLAWRQAKAWLSAHATHGSPALALSHVAEPGWAEVAVAGLEALVGPENHRAEIALDLDRIDVRPEPGEAVPVWLDGLVLGSKDPPTRLTPPTNAGPRGILLLSAGWAGKPRADGVQATVRTTAALHGLAGAEDRLRRRAAGHLARLGVGLLVCARSVDEGLRGLLTDAGIVVWTDAPRGALRRLEACTGATVVARLEDAVAADVGAARLVRRPRRAGWLVQGNGPSATFAVPAHSKPSGDAAIESGERLLRAAGAVLADATVVPGGGRWQRGLASSLRKAADLAPGKAPLAMQGAADAIGSLADDLMRNAGRDAVAGGTLPDADGVVDPARIVRLAVDGAFETAIAILRLDAAYAKRPSSGAGLRGGTGPSGSPKGMPGDLPPLM